MALSILLSLLYTAMILVLVAMANEVVTVIKNDWKQETKELHDAISHQEIPFGFGNYDDEE